MPAVYSPAMHPPLQLHRPLVCLDLETTGLDVQNDRIVEIACVSLLPDGSRSSWSRRCNPQRPIPAAATAIHGIGDVDVAEAPTFAQLAPELLQLLHDADLTGFNVEKFDLPLLRQELRRIGAAYPDPQMTPPPRIVDSMRIFMQREPRHLAAATRFYCGRELAQAHNALADAEAAADVLLAQVQRYEDLPHELEGLDRMCHPSNPNAIDPEGKLVWMGDEAALGFGKYRQRSLRELCDADPDYLRWIAGADFSPVVIDRVREALAGRFRRRGD